MKTSKTGYLRNSPDVNKPKNIIQGGDITMKGVDFKVLGTDDRGYTKVMQPGYDYKFPGAKYVTETPIKKTNMESNKQEKKNLLKDNPIASHGSWISKHSIAAKSPLHMGGSYKGSPAKYEGEKDPTKGVDLKSLEYKPTSEGKFKGEKVALSGEAVIKGTPGKTYKEAGVDPSKAKAYWEANPEKYKAYKAGQKDITVVRERKVDSETKVYPNPFKGKKQHKGKTLDPKITKSDSIPASQITGVFKGTGDKKGYDSYLKKYGYKKTNKPPRTKEELGAYTYKVKS